MKTIGFAYDRKAKKPYYRARHAEINESEFEEAFSSPMAVIGQRGYVLKAVGRTFHGRFLTVVFIRRRNDSYHVLTAWSSRRRQILLWHREMRMR